MKEGRNARLGLALLTLVPFRRSPKYMADPASSGATAMVSSVSPGSSCQDTAPTEIRMRRFRTGAMRMPSLTEYTHQTSPVMRVIESPRCGGMEQQRQALHLQEKVCCKIVDHALPIADHDKVRAASSTALAANSAIAPTAAIQMRFIEVGSMPSAPTNRAAASRSRARSQRESSGPRMKRGKADSATVRAPILTSLGQCASAYLTTLAYFCRDRREDWYEALGVIYI